MKEIELIVAIPCSRSIEFIGLSEIIRIEALQNYCKIITKNSASLVSSINIGRYRKLLDEFDFSSPHKSHLVNKNAIVRYVKSGELEMADGSSVPVSRRRREAFLDELFQRNELLTLDG